ncbi:hypothetical protein AYL99_03848 [Fonsecaea erecta]|uniref:BRCT domain-containing protein n=1 Tax=Fonsecaea erecta TaxID=1367422 RepID=A0A178ZRM4_9EURO|nr:hypothetical protein AYL99_03848 [Fonsecaea erecta]OAP61645.1 hypothetical protein AYL99_03848 [Fonsecaea erecta]
MATDSLLSVDIANLKADILAPLESGHEQPDSEQDLYTSVQLAAVDEADLHPPLPDTGSVSVPQLPSTVPESQVNLTDAESQLQFLPPAFAPNKAVATAQKMTSQGSDAPTQELSPSHYEHLLNRSRSAGQRQGEGDGFDFAQDFLEETGVTFHEGDEGHIDLISSLVSQKGPASDGEDEEVEGDLFPTKSPRAFTQFPESQRFKTPATAGRKRRYNGDVIDSPELPRNPLLRAGEDHAHAHAHVMGLSQAFAATQANTSPFVGGANGDLHSDRPSPNIELQPRPVTATTSSPLRPISDFKRASTEPASRYVSVQQSQALREQARRRQLEILNHDEDSDHDSFDDDGDSYLDREWRRRERDRKIQAHLSSISKQSTRSISASRSSPIPGLTRSSPERPLPMDRPRTQPDSSPTRRDRHLSSNESEEETEQEDNTSVVVTRSSQPIVLLDEEDKENFSDRASQIPETTARLHRVMNDIPTHEVESPLLRHSHGPHSRPVAFSSSQMFAVADSQPERPLKRRRTTTHVPRSSTPDGMLDFVPQSPTSSPAEQVTTNQRDSASAITVGILSAVVDEHLPASEPPTDTIADLPGLSSNTQTRQPPTSTIPETSSNGQVVQSGRGADAKPQIGNAESHDAFDTAQTHNQASTATLEQPVGIELSSPPIVTSPPGRRRKRMAEIAAEPSPVGSPGSFNAAEALELDADFQNPNRSSLSPPLNTGNISEGADLPGSRHSGIRQWEENDDEPELNEASSAPKDQAALGNLELNPDILEEPVQGVPPPITYSWEEGRSATKTLNAPSKGLQTASSRARASQWDLPPSPPQNPIPLSRPSPSVKRKARRDESSTGMPRVLNKKPERAKSAVFRPALPEITEHGQDSSDPIILDDVPDFSAATTPLSDNDAENGTNEPNIAPNMVFACFNGKTRAYHPAICLGRSKSDTGRFLIQWEGFDPDELDEYGVRSLDLRVGDQVKVDIKGFPRVSHVIRGFQDKIEQGNALADHAVLTDIRGYRTVLVAPKQRKDLLSEASAENVKKVPISTVYLDSQMWGQMKDRTYEYKPPSIPAVLPGIATPLDRPSTPSTPSSRTRRGIAATGPPAVHIDLANGLLEKMAFAVSYEDSDRRRYLVDLVQDHGGIILQESFLDLFEPDSIQLKEEFSGFSFAALLTDRHSRKEKYLQALALGLPCISGRWIEVSVESHKIVDWTNYLLPAGESTELEGATKSRILPFSASAEGLRVQDIVSLRPKILSDCQAIVVMGKGKTEAKRRPYLSLVRALDPVKVELEPDLVAVKAGLEAASDDSGTMRYIFVDDREVETAKATLFPTASKRRGGRPKHGRRRGKRKHEGVRTHDDGDDNPETDHGGTAIKVMCNEDIVQSLILGKLWIG